MTLLPILHHYFVWHYSQALASLFLVWRNFLWFTVHFFSLPLLASSLFAPWKRMVESRGDRLDFEAIAGAIVINVFSRLVGAFVRSALILTGLIVLLVECLLLVFIYLSWLLAPFLVIFLLFSGVWLWIA